MALSKSNVKKIRRRAAIDIKYMDVQIYLRNILKLPKKVEQHAVNG
jgi:hypothetical protein